MCDWAALPSNLVVQIFGLAGTCRDAVSWRLACKRYSVVCGGVDVLLLKVHGEAKAAVSELDASRGDIQSTWFGLDLDFAPFELQQVRRAARRSTRRPFW
jgi:hypothetical protein